MLYSGAHIPDKVKEQCRTCRRVRVKDHPPQTLGPFEYEVLPFKDRTFYCEFDGNSVYKYSALPCEPSKDCGDYEPRIACDFQDCYKNVNRICTRGLI